MNIDDVAKFERPATCWLEAIFTRQEELRKKYHEIEKKSGLLQTELHPLDVNDRFCQARIKDFAWRFTEELGEAHECLKGYGGIDWAEAKEVPHFREELIDAMHFLAELTMMLDMDPNWVYPWIGESPSPLSDYRITKLLGSFDGHPVLLEELHSQAFKVTMELGIACNFLKNKPWKQTHQLTDVKAFRHQIVKTWWAFFKLLRYAGFNARMVYDYYFKKSEVNKFRQRSKY